MIKMLRPAALPLIAVGLLVSAAPATASHGHGGDDPAPLPTSPPVNYCPPPPSPTFAPDGSTSFANEVADAGCVVVHVTAAGVESLQQVILAPGWTYSVKSFGGNDSNKVEVQFLQPQTGERHEFRSEPGKLEIR